MLVRMSNVFCKWPPSRTPPLPAIWWPRRSIACRCALAGLPRRAIAGSVARHLAIADRPLSPAPARRHPSAAGIRAVGFAGWEIAAWAPKTLPETPAQALWWTIATASLAFILAVAVASWLERIITSSVSLRLALRLLRRKATRCCRTQHPSSMVNTLTAELRERTNSLRESEADVSCHVRFQQPSQSRERVRNWPLPSPNAATCKFLGYGEAELLVRSVFGHYPSRRTVRCLDAWLLGNQPFPQRRKIDLPDRPRAGTHAKSSRRSATAPSPRRRRLPNQPSACEDSWEKASCQSIRSNFIVGGSLSTDRASTEPPWGAKWYACGDRISISAQSRPACR
jgi:hypothetical protein